MLWTTLTTRFPLCSCVSDCAQGSSGPQQWLCCVGLVDRRRWWWVPGCSEEREEPLLQTSWAEEQELLLMESPSPSSSPLFVLLSLHMQRFRSIFAYTFTDEFLHQLWVFLYNACPLSLSLSFPWFPVFCRFLHFQLLFCLTLPPLKIFFSTPVSLFYFQTF